MLCEIFNRQLFSLLSFEFKINDKRYSYKNYKHEGQNDNNFPDRVTSALGLSKAKNNIFILSTAFYSATTTWLSTAHLFLSSSNLIMSNQFLYIKIT